MAKPTKTMANRRSNTLANWVNTSSALATMVFLMSLLKQYAPYQLRRIIYQFTHQLFDVMFTIDEFSPGILPTRNDDFESIQAYLGKNGSKNAKRLRLSSLLGEKRVLTMDANEEMTDKFNGVTVWWTFRLQRATTNMPFDRRSYKLVFHKKYKEIISGKYLDHVISEGKKIRECSRTRKLFLNKAGLSVARKECLSQS